VTLASSARSGAWLIDLGCATISESPHRVAMRFRLWERQYAQLCSLTVRPLGSFAVGYDSLPILAYLVPSTLTCVVDSLGRVTITPASGTCLDYWDTSDSLALIVGGTKGCFAVVLYDHAGPFGSGWVCVDCDAWGAPPVGVDPPASVLSNFIALRSANPWRSGDARIVFGLVKTEKVELKVYDLSGKVVRTLTDRVFEGGIEHLVTWDGDTDSGGRVPPGVYFYRLRTPSFTGRRKLLVLRN
jgi:hypothetical protein